MAISAKQVNELRKATGAGMMDCKKALVETDGDFDKAIEVLRKKGQKVSAKRADNETSEGTVFVKANEDYTEVVSLSLVCETDFVAINDEYQALGNAILDAAAAAKPADVEGIMALSLGDMTVAEKITETIGKFGEKIVIKNYEVITGEKVVAYIHSNKKLGVIVTLANVGEADYVTAGKDVGMQIAAMNPIALSSDDVDEATKAKELEIGREIALKEGKPEAIVDKIAQGKLQKFFKDNTLLAQDFVKDNSMSVAKYLDSLNKGMTVVSFKRITVG
ncbi:MULTISPECIES: translation elongation factor Ts [Persicobacter]|uniref:Elongation factor Ts n=1 Tax=Persicobacter diffluens TaxID=981 RepID=A0AAN4VVI4_9BACT|nr:translation elongation factor Ts [Persicobacter sp. CCB-QB2]GJM59836.1 elongation factor Ts [Persicobacter diffluens]